MLVEHRDLPALERISSSLVGEGEDEPGLRSAGLKEDQLQRIGGYLSKLAGFLETDDWELVEVAQVSGRPVYEGRRREAIKAPAVAFDVDEYENLGDPQVVREHLRRIDRDLKSDPAAAIGSSKELLKTVLKNILDDYVVLVAQLPGAEKETCGSSSKPEYCSNVTALEESVDELGSVQFEGGFLDTLKADLNQVQKNARESLFGTRQSARRSSSGSTSQRSLRRAARRSRQP